MCNLILYPVRTEEYFSPELPFYVIAWSEALLNKYQRIPYPYGIFQRNIKSKVQVFIPAVRLDFKIEKYTQFFFNP